MNPLLPRRLFSHLWLLLLALLVPSGLTAATPPAPESALVVPLWPEGAPDSQARMNEPERASFLEGPGYKIPIVSNIHHPSLTVYLPPAELATGAAIIVAPGGSHRFLAIQHEGHAVGRWFAAHGIATFILKYRLAFDEAGNSPYRIEVHELADAQRAVQLVRARATEWRVDPARIGLMGFSAGGEVALLGSTHPDPQSKDTADAIGRFSAHPDFQVLIYPGFNPEIRVPRTTPPTFLLCAYDDFPADTLPALFTKLKAAGVSTELHIYRRGGHGFGLSDGDMPVASWPLRLREWMADSGLLAPSTAK